MVHDPWGEVVQEAQRLRAQAEGHLGWPHVEIEPELPPEAMGDLAFPAFPYAPQLHSTASALATQLQGAMSPGTLLASTEAVGPYVNFRLNLPTFGRMTLDSILHRERDYGSLQNRGKRVIVEHTSVNPNGPIHVGRLRNPLIGDALARLLHRAGYQVTREYLVNDVGKQIILMYWGWKHLKSGDIGAPEKDRDEYRFVKYYQEAVRRAKEDPAVEAEVMELARRYEQGDVTLAEEVKKICQRVLQGMLSGLRELGITFDHFFWESETILNGKAREIADGLRALPQAHQEADGAYYLDLGDPSLGIPGESSRWYFLRKDDTTLYTTRDVAYHLDKFSRCDEAVNVLGEDQKLGALQLRAALRLLGVGREPHPVFYAFVVLPEGRFSTRKGVVLWADDLVEEALERAYAEVDSRRQDMSEVEKRRVARVVGIGALKFHYLKVQPEKKIVFRWDEALSFDGSSAPFIQYAHARTCGILEKAGGTGVWDAGALHHPTEVRLLKALARFPQTIGESAEGRRPHALAAYAIELAGLLNEFYRDCPVIASPEPLRSSRLALVNATRIVLRNGLDTLGIEAPKEM